MAEKKTFFGLGPECDYHWMLTEEQKTLKDKLIDICLTKIIPYAIQCDKTYEFPRKSIDHLAEIGLLGLMIPKELGGLGESHLFMIITIETIARYGCPSTALVMCMHMFACAFLLLRCEDNHCFKRILSRCNEEKLIGACGGSDPSSGGHFWYLLTSKFERLEDEKFRILKYISWMTSAGYADWYISFAATDPNDYSKFSTFLVFKDEVRASTSDWKSLGVRGNQSGPVIIDGIFSKDRIVTTGSELMAEVAFLLAFFNASANGVSLAAIDLAKKHVTTKVHADTGKRVCDYETIQDYFGEAVSKTNAARSHLLMYALALDKATNNCDWSLHSDPDFMPRSNIQLPMYETRLISSINVEEVTNKMLHACGGHGYKTELGLERLLRDGRATWLMGPSAEISRQTVGKIALLGMENFDLWERNCNKRALHHELKKMSLEKKKELALSLLEEVKREESEEILSHPYQDTDFINPLNTAPPSYSGQPIKTEDGAHHNPALNPKTPVKLKLLSKEDIGMNMAIFTFELPGKYDYTGCLPGQFIMIRIKDPSGRIHDRHISPISPVDDFGKLEIVLKYETHGFFSKAFDEMKKGEEIECLGPCGGFEYEANKLDELSLIVSGSGITAGLQIIRTAMSNPSDKTKISLIYFSESIEEMIYREELLQYESSDGRFRCLLTLGEVTENWKGEDGHIDTHMIEWSLPKRNDIKHKVVVCGGATMITSCLHSLKSLHCPSDDIYIYGYVGTNHLRAVYGRNIKMSGHRC